MGGGGHALWKYEDRGGRLGQVGRKGQDGPWGGKEWGRKMKKKKEWARP